MLDEHLGYVGDAVRLDQFSKAVNKTVTPGDLVADMGCGTGVLGLLALKAGAARVFFIDESAMIDVARETMRHAGFAGRATCLHGRSSQLELPEQVDVVICDHVGYFGFDYGIVQFLDDARRRFLKPGGKLVPSRIKLYVAAVESTQCSELVNGWRAEHVPPEFHWLQGYAANTKYAVKLDRKDLLGEPAELGVLDLYANNPAFFSWSVELHIGRDAVMHGLAGWFGCELADGVWMTNSPLSDKPINRAQAFLPMEEPVQVKAGDVVRATIMARPADNLIAWVVEFPSSGKRFSHSTWQGMLFGEEDLIRANPDRTAKLRRAGRARTTVLQYCDGKRTVKEIERLVLSNHPDLFPSSAEISSFVLRVLGRDTE